MPRTAIAGTRIRRLRIDRQMRQTDLAAACDISPSYLNLIEHNHRRIGGALMNRVAAALKVEAAVLSGGADSSLVMLLQSVADRQGLDGDDAKAVDDFAGRFPDWARVVESQDRRLRELEQVVEALNDRLAFDPYLSASMHTVLSSVTAIRSASGILSSGERVEPEWQARFHRNLFEDSQRLTDAVERLVTYLDSEAEEEIASVLPQDELQVWIESNGWHVDNTDAVDQTDTLTSEAARELARQYVERCISDGAKLQTDQLVQSVSGLGCDPIAIASRLSADLGLVIRRIATLPDSVFPNGVAPGLVICDGSGALFFRKPLRGFEPPKFGAACAAWPLYEALQRPGAPVSANVLVRGRDDMPFRAYAYASVMYPAGYERAPVTEALMLMVPEMSGDAITEQRRIVGSSCRVCPERTCPARREPTILGAPGDDLVGEVTF